ncbi:putative glycosyltransferase [Rhizobium sp. BK181]|uniref:glycosyltransferase family 2 protein n=1 Tax=Rhizobium sp. BK181 TaxID=2587072 RepID=UPI00161A294F|nr:glycosyltransferase family 2 protein [Rhizobium sp. BK181]MBB3315503.1 putative glycosyltransferase [Rhizobium sp. BK181]
MKLSVVATLYRSAPYLAEFYQRATSSAQKFAADDYEIVLVNDGSPDNSLQMAVHLTESDPHVVVVDLSRNFGHHKAMRAGLEHARGDLVFLIDSDLEEEPEWLTGFADQMAAENSDVVFGVQTSRKGDFVERWSGHLYYAMLNWLLNIDHPKNITTSRLMTRRYVNALLMYQEREAVISCLWVLTGFKQSPQAIKKHMTSETTYRLPKKISHLVNAVTSFSDFPLRMIFYCGVFVLTCALFYTFFLVVNRLYTAEPVDGWTSIMVSVWLLGGTIISFIGIIGIYLSKIFSETKQRPYVIVRNIYGQSGQQH